MGRLNNSPHPDREYAFVTVWKVTKGYGALANGNCPNHNPLWFPLSPTLTRRLVPLPLLVPAIGTITANGVYNFEKDEAIVGVVGTWAHHGLLSCLASTSSSSSHHAVRNACRRHLVQERPGRHRHHRQLDATCGDRRVLTFPPPSLVQATRWCVALASIQSIPPSTSRAFVLRATSLLVSLEPARKFARDLNEGKLIALDYRRLSCKKKK